MAANASIAMGGGQTASLPPIFTTISHSTTTTSSGSGPRRRGRPSSLTIQEFLKLEDRELQNYIMSEKSVYKNDYISKFVDNEKKMGFYVIEEFIRKNNQGVFYRATKVNEWIVYNKTTKKVRVSKMHAVVMTDMLHKYFAYPNIVKRFVRKISPTLAKKIIEGKIQTVKDLLIYERSYGLRDKNLAPETLYTFVVNGNPFLVQNYEHPEKVTPEELGRISASISYSNVIKSRAFKLDGLTVDQIHKKYGQWCEEQSKKFDTLLRLRNEEVRIVDGEEFEP